MSDFCKTKLESNLRVDLENLMDTYLESYESYDWFRAGLNLYDYSKYIFGSLLIGCTTYKDACDHMLYMLHDLIDDGCCHFVHVRCSGTITMINKECSFDRFRIYHGYMYNDNKSRLKLAKNVIGHVPNLDDVEYEIVASTRIDGDVFVELVEFLMSKNLKRLSLEEYLDAGLGDTHEYNFTYLSDVMSRVDGAFTEFLENHPDDGSGYE